MDGTLLNTLDDLTICTNEILTRHNYPNRTISEMRNFVGNGIKKMIERALPSKMSSDIINNCYEEMLEFYKLHSGDHTMPYYGVKVLLEKLKKTCNVNIAIVTNKAQESAEEIGYNFFGNSVDIIVGDDKITPLKPNPDNILKVLNKFNCELTDAIYIGDSEVDIATAKNSNLNFIAVSWGFRDKSFLLEQGANIIANNAEELYDILKTL